MSVHWIVKEGARRVDTHFDACVSGPCDQGRRLCPSPQACQRSGEQSERWVRAAMWLLAVAVLAIVSGVVVTL